SIPLSVRTGPVAFPTKRTAASGRRCNTSYGPMASSAVIWSKTGIAISTGPTYGELARCARVFDDEPFLRVLAAVQDPARADRAELERLRSETGVALPPPFVEIRGDEPVRVATERDTAAFAAVRHRGWQVAYRDLLPDDLLAAM